MRWMDAETGYECIIREGGFKCLCGYVVLQPTHPLHGVAGDDFYSSCDLSVHGGITWTGPLEDYPDLWLVGFDCGHAWDILPGLMQTDPQIQARKVATGEADIEEVCQQELKHIMGSFTNLLFEGATYKDIHYVVNETLDLARQLKYLEG